MKALLATLALALAICSCSADTDSPYVRDGQAAKAFCAKPELKKLECGFASEAEESATTDSQCPYCGTLYFKAPVKLPGTLVSHPVYNQYATRTISVACSGKVLVRSVFKITKQPQVTLQTIPGLQGTSCTYSRLVAYDNSNTVVRCELQLPSGPGSETERAVRGKEVNCYKCGLCKEGFGCPSKAGVWYSDSYARQVTGCGFNAAEGYEAKRVSINVNANTEVLLAKYEVCNSPSCFNQAYEEAKIKSAKSCIKGKCQ